MSDAGRVIAGTARGTRLAAPGEGTRPFADRVKQTLFAILEPDLRNARVLDLFAGSGAGGIEALSRGAAWAVFVERDAIAARVIGENLTKARVVDRGLVRRADVIAYLRAGAVDDGPFDLVLADPPYAEPALLEAALGALAVPETGLLTAEAWVVAKHFWRTPPPPAVGLLASVRTRRFGETVLAFYRRRVAAPGEAGDLAAAQLGRPVTVRSPSKRKEAR
jgi:16S rRNA (guanine(966)-N(2))-methyltransferase RsmD